MGLDAAMALSIPTYDHLILERVLSLDDKSVHSHRNPPLEPRRLERACPARVDDIGATPLAVNAATQVLRNPLNLISHQKNSTSMNWSGYANTSSTTRFTVMPGIKCIPNSR
jgi:hypothetical protein